MTLSAVENEEIYSFDQDDQFLDATRIQMVLGSLEKSLVDKIISNIDSVDTESGAGLKCKRYF